MVRANLTVSVVSLRYAFPRLLDQCAEGWVNNIVFTNTPNTRVRLFEMPEAVFRLHQRITFA